jgi:hypothetical protein
MVQQFTFPKNGTDTVEVIRRAMNVEPIRKLRRGMEGET